MAIQKHLWFPTVLLFLVVISTLAEEVYVGQGRSLVLSPPKAAPKPFTGIVWKHKGNLVAEWVDKKLPLFYYPKYQGRTTLNTTTGRLEISRTTTDDTGVYIVEINSVEQPDTYNVKVVMKVSKPTISVKPLSCNPSSDICTLSCDGVATDTEPVTYSWKEGDGQWTERGKDWIITKTVHQGVKTFTCRMKNLLSEEESDAHENPLNPKTVSPSGSNGGMIAGVIIGVFLVILVAVGAWFWFCRPQLIRDLLNPSEEVNSSPNENGSKPHEKTELTTMDD